MSRRERDEPDSEWHLGPSDSPRWPWGGCARRGLLGHALVTFTFVCGIAGNSLGVWLLSCRTPYNMYVLHLAMANLLFLLCMATTQPLARELLHRVKYFAYTAGLSLLTAISGQRCLSILFPICYKRHRPRRLSAGVCAGLWALSLIMNTLGLVFCRWAWRSNKKHCFLVDSVLISLILSLFTPMMAMSSLTLFVRVKRSPLCRRRQPTRLYVVILGSRLVYLTCVLPLGLCWFFLYWLDLQPKEQLLSICLARLSSSVSSSANPVIYFLVGTRRGQGLPESLGAMLHRVPWATPELEGKETPSSYTNEVGG